ncbi:MAG: SGNH/GDSL hydrolase family protein [Planctomycetes bacterium]|nr:SGNH/GDSL hydrolase family protein [Planctomycetota bacterium]
MSFFNPDALQTVRLAMMAVAALVVIAAPCGAGESLPLEPASLMSIRGGMPNVAARIRNGEPVSMVWIGGSITVGGGRPQGHITAIEAWLRRTYPGVKLTVHNAGIDGTGSDYGAMRFDRDVLAHEPDMVLIEFAVNDGDRDRSAHIERMVRKAWTRRPTADLLIYYTVAQSHLPHLDAGHLPPSASAHERVAARYGIPTISLGVEVQQRIAAGTLAWPQFSGDSCHPTDAGSAIFTDVFQRCLPGLLAAGTPGQHVMPDPLTAGLVLWPPAAVAQSMPVAAAMTDPAGKAAEQTWELPRPGTNWVGDPVYTAADGRPLWRLTWLDRGRFANRVERDAQPLERAWEGNAMSWLEEARNFQGPSGVQLFGASGFGAGRREIGVIVFSAPSKGRYRIDSATTGIDIYRNEDKRMSLALIRFGWKGSTGSLLAHAMAAQRDGHGVHIAAETDMIPGEELVLLPNFEGPGYVTPQWRGLTVRIGCFAP